MNIVDKDLVKKKKVVKSKVEIWKASHYKKILYTVKDLSVFYSKLLFLIKTFLKEKK